MNTPKLPPFKRTVNGQLLNCDGVLTDFEILKQSSTMIDYFGISRQHSKLFVQFNNGDCFMYSEVPVEKLEEAKAAESIGKFFHANIKGKFDDQRLGAKMITIAPPDFDLEQHVMENVVGTTVFEDEKDLPEDL